MPFAIGIAMKTVNKDMYVVWFYLPDCHKTGDSESVLVAADNVDDAVDLVCRQYPLIELTVTGVRLERRSTPAPNTFPRI